MSLIPFGFWAASGAGGVQYWLSTFGGSQIDEGYGVVSDNNHVYFIGYSESSGAGSYDVLLVKSDKLGIIQWQRTLGTAGAELGTSVTLDSSGNVYLSGTTPVGGTSYFLIAKYNSSGTIQWQRTLGATDGNESVNSIALDSTDAVYVCGASNSPGEGSNDVILAKYDSAGTIQWQRRLGGSNAEIAQSLAIDSSDNVYFVGDTRSEGEGGQDLLIVKYNSSGTLQWQRTLGSAAGESGYGLVLDSSNNAYVCGRAYVAASDSNEYLIAKYNSSGTLQWQRTLGGSAQNLAYSISVDSNNNPYVFGYTTANGNDFLIAKYNSAGTIQWQRTLGGNLREEGYSVNIDSSDSIFLLGTTTSTGEGNGDFLAAHLPNDGSLTGTYVLDGVNMVYQASTLTSSTSSYTSSTSTLTATTASLTSATSTLTSSTSTLTSHLTLIP